MEGYERKEGMDNDREEIYSKAVRAGKRTYFFDVKATRNNDYYLTITESRDLITTGIKISRSIKSFCTKKILKSLLKV